ncbi:MAG: hypothetical protein M3Y40_07270 [Chloroflexota bacterium]|nr:hypothetical protein [Chloroflexota bacterium]
MTPPAGPGPGDTPAIVADPAASIEDLFAHAGALLDGHFLLKSGRHAGRYLEKFLVLQHPVIGVELCRRFAEALAPHEPTLVVGPTTGGVLLSFETARQLGGSVRAAFAEPVAAAVIVDRSSTPVELGFPLHALGRLDIPSWQPDACELCAAGIPMRKPGSS